MKYGLQLLLETEKQKKRDDGNLLTFCPSFHIGTSLCATLDAAVMADNSKSGVRSALCLLWSPVCFLYIIMVFRYLMAMLILLAIHFTRFWGAENVMQVYQELCSFTSDNYFTLNTIILFKDLYTFQNYAIPMFREVLCQRYTSLSPFYKSTVQSALLPQPADSILEILLSKLYQAIGLPTNFALTRPHYSTHYLPADFSFSRETRRYEPIITAVNTSLQHILWKGRI